MGASTDRSRRRLWSATWREARQLLWARRWRLFAGLLLLLLGRLAGLVLPASTKVLVDQVIGERRAELLPLLALAVAVASLVQATASHLVALLVGVAAQRSIADLRRSVQAHLGRLPIRFFDDHKSGELVSRVMSDAEGIRNLVGGGLVQLVGSSLTALLAAVVLLWLDWRLTVVTMALVGVFLAVMIAGVHRLRPLFRQRAQIAAEVTGRLTEGIGGIRVTRAYHAEKREERLFAAGVHRLLRLVVRTVRGVSALTSSFSLIFGLTGAAMAWVGAHAVLAGRMTVGDLVMYLAFTGLMVAPLIQLVGLAPQLVEAFAGLDRIREILAEPTEASSSGAFRLPVVEGHVVFEDVTFAYRSGQPVLRQIGFTADAGSTTALVGPSGAGKSTLIRLILAFDRPLSGRISVDGHDLASVHLGDYRSHLGIVLQESFLFDGTVRDNIAYSRPKATDAEIVEAARLARCEDFVAAFPDGYDTVIGERGIRLSGGQRQRIAIARAVLAEPRILILDEATSSLDSESEIEIQRGLAALMRGRTSFVIAHRLSTVINADQILVLDEGRIVERGSHAELLQRGGLYARLFEAQLRMLQNRFANPGEEPFADPPGEAHPEGGAATPELARLRPSPIDDTGA